MEKHPHYQKRKKGRIDMWCAVPSSIRTMLQLMKGAFARPLNIILV
jgi:hypothetical protein